jgi:hypothetical protein
MLRMIEVALRARFGEEGISLMPAITELNDEDKYVTLHQTIATAASLDDVRQACAAAAAPTRRRKKSSEHGRRTQRGE